MADPLNYPSRDWWRRKRVEPTGGVLTEVYSEISGVKESIAGINIPNIDGLKKDIKEIKAALSEIEENLL